MIWGKIIEGDHIRKGKLNPKVPMIWGKSIERDHIIKGKTKYCGGVKIRDKKNVGYVENGRVRVSSSEECNGPTSMNSYKMIGPRAAGLWNDQSESSGRPFWSCAQ